MIFSLRKNHPVAASMAHRVRYGNLMLFADAITVDPTEDRS